MASLKVVPDIIELIGLAPGVSQTILVTIKVGRGSSETCRELYFAEVLHPKPRRGCSLHAECGDQDEDGAIEATQDQMVFDTWLPQLRETPARARADLRGIWT